jgi:putative flippase GtrA
MRFLRLRDRWRRVDLSLVRFFVVGALGEALYLLLFALASRVGVGSLQAILIAGGICLALNAVLHARISFRVRFRWPLLIDYLLIQLFCLLLALALGWMLDRLRFPTMGVGVASGVLWSGASFLLTRWRFQRPPRDAAAAGLSSRHTSQRP